MSLMMSTYVHVRSQCSIGLKNLMVKIIFLTVTGMTCTSTSMYISPFNVLLKLSPLHPKWVSENNAFVSFPSIVASFSQIITIVSSGKSVKVNPVPIGIFSFTVSPSYPTTVTFILVKFPITHAYPQMLKVSPHDSSNTSAVSYSHFYFTIF